MLEETDFKLTVGHVWCEVCNKLPALTMGGGGEGIS